MPYPKGKPQSPESIAKRAASLRRVCADPAYRQAISERMQGARNPFFGKTHNPKTRAVLSAQRLGIPLPAQTREKLSALRRGRKLWYSRRRRTLTMDHREKIAAAHRGRKRPAPWLLGRSPSAETRAKISAAQKGRVAHNRGIPNPKMRGSLNHNWKGGDAREKSAHRRRVEYYIWRKAVWERDDFTCQRCRYRGDGVIAHHRRAFAKYPELRFIVDNGVTLCKECHLAVHRLKDPTFIDP